MFHKITNYLKNLFTHASSHRKVRHDWLPSRFKMNSGDVIDVFHPTPVEKLGNIPNQEILGDIRSILWPNKYIMINGGKTVLRRNEKNGRFESLKKVSS